MVGLDAGGCVLSRTLKYLRAVVQGCWVVGWGWVQGSVAAGHWLEEVEFLAKVGGGGAGARGGATGMGMAEGRRGEAERA